jgi:serine/threonine protein kinase
MAPHPSSPAADPLIGRLINDRYRIASLVARGGMGRVYRAEQAPLGREVALKVLHPRYEGDHDPEFQRRFFLEASTCAKLSHPNTVTIFDYGRTEDDIYYIAMELLEGRTLHRAVRTDGPFAPQRAMHIARQVCRSLREAHKSGLVHRDLKPANVFLMRHGDEEDFVKVLDFGLVKDIETPDEDLTETGLFMGSPKYMSPEQIRGENVDGRCDVYALGVMLYEMLTG